jgi:hypothetical protein
MLTHSYDKQSSIKPSSQSNILQAFTFINRSVENRIFSKKSKDLKTNTKYNPL